jgi:hypothetical protein
MKMSESIPGTVILSGNFITQDTPGINYTILGLDRYRQRSNRNIVPFFFLSTDLLAYSFFYSYKKFEKYSYESNVYHHGHFVKKKCYQLLGANLAVPRKKLTGFEKIKEHFDTIHVPKLKLKYSKMGSARPFDLIYRYSLFEDIGFYSEEARIIHPGNLNPTIKKS